MDSERTGRELQHLGLVTLPPGDVYQREYADAALNEFGRDGAWLLLSIEHVSWRAHYDLCLALIRGMREVEGHRGSHLQSLVDLHVQAAMFAVVEQFGRLVAACRAHESGTEAFFDAYTKKLGIGGILGLIDAMKSVTADELEQLLGAPTSLDDVAAWLRGRSPELGVNEAASLAADGLGRLRTVLTELAANAAEVAVLVTRSTVEVPDGEVLQGQSLRNVDNAYRHGTMLLWQDVQPAERSFVAIGYEHAPSDEATVHLVVGSAEPKFATVVNSDARLGSNMKVIEAVSVRLRQLAVGMLRSRALRVPESLVFLDQIDVDRPDPSLDD